MTDDELSRAVALVCVWEPWPQRQVPEAWKNPRGGMDIPRFATSLDACSAPGGPVEYVKAKGWTLRLVIDEAGTYAAIHDGRLAQPFLVDASDDDAPRALCLAFLAAIEVMK